ncbi:DUF1934 domain-containing protein [Paenibacillus hamazuiensis]|uniref:DUF1934 domain-containing protein n=1 Tax=Paenibacillus hamazuiensis TaxID=2936508 RepID=UPI00200C94A4
MTSKQAVSIRVSSASEGQRIDQRYNGDLYLKGDYAYLRYAESETELGKTTTVIKIGREEIRILRQGDVVSEQSFAKGKRLAGYYETPRGRLTLETETDSMSIEIEEGIGVIRWSYLLLAGNDQVGRYSLQLDIRPAGGG